ncbi:pentapeptide repeat-containing protein [Saccharothrix deserti]|uniref:pentapeptide repeat-containing protein n=1 Tax=Saccharothrix deserti TaxID=2593674 RepID=UPI00131CE94B|nr:pentapeptide repeat-containing protein [Saccharothrix deserti]
MPQRRRPRRSRPDWSQISTLLTALAAVGALVFTGLSVRATQEQLDLARAALVSDRFTKAVEHLGNDKMDIRLGAVLELERVARDSADDQEAIGSLLAAFVRRARPLNGPCSDDLSLGHTDVSAALRVLTTASVGPVTDLSLTCLSGADLRRADLSGAKLNGADLTDPRPAGANLNDAKLGEAKLRDTDLRYAFLLRADLTRADLSAADLRNAQLRDADLTGANLQRAKLTGADLTGARLTGANIRDAVMAEDVRADAVARGAVTDPTPSTPAGCTS